jgi:hypothetical protein
MVRLTAGQYAYARVRGRMPRSKEWPDWRCYLVAQGMDIDAAARADRNDHKGATVITARWNRIPGVKREIEHEREMALAPVKLTAEAWWAKVKRLEAMASGELPMVRTVVELVPGDEDGEGKKELLTRKVTFETYYETQLPVLSKAIEMQGKALSVFVDKTEVSGPGGGPILTETEEQNRARIAELLAKANPAKPGSGGSGGG